jgi:hypothetical protein
MILWRESARIVLYRCCDCASIHADLKPYVVPRPLPGQDTIMQPPQALNCPKCPRKLEYVYTTEKGNMLVYVCTEHGQWLLGPSGLHPPPTPTHRIE